MSNPSRHYRPQATPRFRGPVRSAASSSPFSRPLTLKAKVMDVCLVAVWGASIPGLLWLGSMGGF